jgi:hypothetical protein
LEFYVYMAMLDFGGQCAQLNKLNYTSIVVKSEYKK